MAAALGPNLSKDITGTSSSVQDTSRSEYVIADAQQSLNPMVHHIVPMETVSSGTKKDGKQISSRTLCGVVTVQKTLCLSFFLRIKKLNR